MYKERSPLIRQQKAYKITIPNIGHQKKSLNVTSMSDITPLDMVNMILIIGIVEGVIITIVGLFNTTIARVISKNCSYY